MAKQSKKPADLNRLAAAIVADATDTNPSVPEKRNEPEVKLSAQETGRKGGLKGGPARAKQLSSAQRSQIAQKAARARWSKREEA